VIAHLTEAVSEMQLDFPIAANKFGTLKVAPTALSGAALSVFKAVRLEHGANNLPASAHECGHLSWSHDP
jgi:hypothetical protein